MGYHFMFESALLKLERANKHILAFSDAYQRFIDGRPVSLRCDGRHQGLSYFLTLDQSPVDAMIIAGDALHNLRSALDHCVWELWTHDVPPMQRARNWHKGIKFPTCSSVKIDYDASVRGMATPRADAIQLLLDLEVYPSGNGAPLLALHNLDITDKHLILIPLVTRFQVSGLRVRHINMDGTETTGPLGVRQGEMMLTPDGETHFGSHFAIGNIGYYSKDPTQPQLEFSDDYSVEFEMLFADHQPFAGLPILPTLSALSNLVCEVIARFQAVVAARR